MTKRNTFLELFTDPSPALNVKFSMTSDEKPIKVLVKHRLGPPIEKKGRQYIESIAKDDRLTDFLDFYLAHDGLEFCTPSYPDNFFKRPLFKIISASNISNFSNQYVKKGEWAWTIDLNKSKALYRGDSNWIAFAEVGSGPACLSIFLTGENAGGVYLITPQPAFNILKPIAKTFDLFLARIAKDPAAFLRLIRSYATLKGVDGQNYGYLIVDYLSNSNG